MTITLQIEKYSLSCARKRSIGSYREIAIAIESEAGDSLTPSIDQSGFSRKERNLHCDVHVAPENEHILP